MPFPKLTGWFNEEQVNINQILEDNLQELDMTAEVVEGTRMSEMSRADWATFTRPDCKPDACDRNDPMYNKNLIAGLTLEEVIRDFPYVDYTVSQIIDFIFKANLIAVDKTGVKDEARSSKLLDELYVKDNTGVTNHQVIMSATKEALLYGRAGIYKASNGEFKLFKHNNYTVVINTNPEINDENKIHDTSVDRVLGYILYPSTVTNRPAVVDVAVSLNSDGQLNIDGDTTFNDWVSGALFTNTAGSTYDSSGVSFVRVTDNRFVNLRYDVDSQAPTSRLIHERNRIENSIYLHQSLDIKFNEKGVGRLILQLKNNLANDKGEAEITKLINENKEARQKSLNRVKNYGKTLADKIKHLQSDDVIVLPSNIEASDRLENTNNPSLYLDILKQDQTILASAYGIPATLLGLGNLSDRNISIASLNGTAEETTIKNVRTLFFNQLSVLFEGGHELILVGEPPVDQAAQIANNKTVADTVNLLHSAGLDDIAKQYAETYLSLDLTQL